MNSRSFLKHTAAYVSAPAILSAKSPNSMFQVTSIGVGGMGGNTMMGVLQHPNVRIVGLCDVDAKTLELATKGMSSRRKELQDPAAKKHVYLQNADLWLPSHRGGFAAHPESWCIR